MAEKGLAGALQSRALAAQATLAAAERQKKIDQDLAQLADLRAQLLRGEGNAAAASAIEIEKKYGALQKRLQEAGNTEGAGLVSKLINIEQAKAELDQLSQMLDGVFSEQSRREQTINTQQQAGLISELGARQQILDLNQLTADQVEKLLPKMRELAAVTGDPAAIERVKDLEARLGALRVVANEFTNALKAGFETGIQNALQGLARGTMDVREAATAFIQDIASAMADLAAQQLASMATSSAMSLFGGGESNGSDMTAGAAAVAGSAAALATAGSTLLTGAAAIEAAAVTLAAANGKATTSGSSDASGWLSSIMSWFSSSGSGGASAGGASSYTGAFGFATGGHVRGPGTSTSDSIPALLSDYEYVTRAAVVTQPGALPFLDDFNARGMVAIDDWQSRIRHSTGGLAGVPAPALAAPRVGAGRLAESGSSRSTTVKNAINLNLIDSPDRIASVLATQVGNDAFTVMLSRDPAKFRSILGINS